MKPRFSTLVRKKPPLTSRRTASKHLETRQHTTVGLRLVREGRVGYASSNSLEDADRLVEMALATAPFGNTARFEFPGAGQYPKVTVFDPTVEKVSIESMIAMGQGMIDALLKHTPALFCEASVTREIQTCRVINSRGADASYRKSVFALGIEGNLTRDTDMLFVGDGEASCHPLSDTVALTQRLTTQLEWARQVADVPTKTMPVIFTPNGVTSALMSPLMSAFNGKTVLEGASPVGDKLGQTVFDTKFSLKDDPTLPFQPASSPADDETVPSQSTPLIEDGRVTGFFYDLQTAARAGTSQHR